MRRSPGQEEKERLLRLRMVAEVLLRIARLRDGVVAFPIELFGAVGVIRRVVVVVRAFEHLPVVKTLPPFARDEVRAPMPIHMPLADAARVIARRRRTFAIVTASGFSGTSFRKTPCVSGRCPVSNDARIGEQPACRKRR